MEKKVYEKESISENNKKCLKNVLTYPSNLILQTQSIGQKCS